LPFLLTSLSPATHPHLLALCSGYAIFLLRMVTACEIKRRADFFAPFIMVRVPVG